MPAPLESEHRVTLPDGRKLAVATAGPPEGWPVFLIHGTPGSRSGPKPRNTLLHLMGVRLITYDRPGYGDSTRHEGRRVASAADDVRATADALGIDRFSVAGRSGGGPHALACAALLPDRVSRTAVLVGIAPPNAAGLQWYEGMSRDNVREYSTAENDLAILIERLRLRAERTVHNPETLIELLREQMAEADRRVVGKMAIRRIITAAYTDALRAGPHGWLDDILAFRDDWGFQFDTIDCPVRLWHGADDTFSPANHARWLAQQIRDAEVQVLWNTAHFGAVEVLPELLAWLREGADQIG